MGFVHRDIKPENVLIAQNAEGLNAKISDFGLAKSFRGVGLSGLTFSGEMRGTVPFMPPEQMLDFKTVTPLADLYASAATLYYMITCNYVYDEASGGGDLIRMLMEESPIPIRERRADVPRARRRHQPVPVPRPQGALSRRRVDAERHQAVLLSPGAALTESREDYLIRRAQAPSRRPRTSCTTERGVRNSRL